MTHTPKRVRMTLIAYRIAVATVALCGVVSAARGENLEAAIFMLATLLGWGVAVLHDVLLALANEGER